MTISTHLFDPPDPHLEPPRDRAPVVSQPPRPVRVALLLSVVALVAMVCASVLGFVVDGLYGPAESTASMLQGYDLVTLLCVAPLLGLSAAGVVTGSERGKVLWLGALAYAVYGYAIYLFGTGFNDAFLLHVLAFASSAVALGIGLATADVERLKGSYRPRTPVKAVAGVLALLAFSLGTMWIVVSVQNVVTGDVPAGSVLVETGTIVHLGIVLDLAVLVPAYLVAAVLLWRRAAWGYLLASVVLVSGLLHQVSYLVALGVQAAEDVPGAKGFDAVEPFIAALYVFGVVVMVGGMRARRRRY